jgi:hypothetical protein
MDGGLIFVKLRGSFAKGWWAAQIRLGSGGSGPSDLDPTARIRSGRRLAAWRAAARLQVGTWLGARQGNGRRRGVRHGRDRWPEVGDGAERRAPPVSERGEGEMGWAAGLDGVMGRTGENREVEGR